MTTLKARLVSQSIRCTLGLLLGILLLSSVAYSQPKIRPFGFGLSLGDPYGITLKGSLGSGNSWEGTIGSSWFGNLRVHGMYLWDANVFNSSKAGMYFGLGGVVGFGRGKGLFIRNEGGKWYYYEDEDALALGARGTIGLNFMPFTSPVEFFIDLNPIIGLVPTSGFGFEGAIGIRYYP